MAGNQGARLTRTYTDQQRQAMLKAVLSDGMGIAEAERAAMNGLLGLPPFGRRRFGYPIIYNGRETYETKNEEALEAGTAKALKDAHLANLRALRALGEDADPAERARVAKALADTHRARGQVNPKGRSRKAEAPSEAPAKGEDVLGQLVQLAPG